MLSGILTKDTLTSALRAISQKRRSGVLEVSTKESCYQVVFQSGKITCADKRSSGQGELIARRLLLAGQLDAESAEALKGEQLAAIIAGLPAAECELLKRAAAVVQMDLLAEIWGLESGRFDFASRAAPDGIFAALMLSPMQLLIDLAEDDATKAALVQKAGCRSPDDILIEPREGASALPVDKQILEMLASGMKLQELAELVLLEGVAFRQAILRLAQQGLVSLSTPGTGTESAGRRSGVIERNLRSETALVEFPDDPGDLADKWRALLAGEEQAHAPRAAEIDHDEAELQTESYADFALHDEEQERPQSQPLEETGRPELESDDDLMLTVEEDLLEPEQVARRVVVVDEKKTQAPRAGGTAVKPRDDTHATAVVHVEGSTESRSSGGVLPVESSRGQTPLAAALKNAAVQQPLPPTDALSRQTGVQRVGRILLDPQMRPLISAGITVFYLALLAYCLPPMLEGWFVELRRLVLER